MTKDQELRSRAYRYFLEEAPELLQIIEKNLLILSEEPRAMKVNEMMRATHTLKGGANAVGLERIKNIAHSLEDIFRCLFHQDIPIDSELQGTLIQAYECLQVLVTATLTDTSIDFTQVQNKADSVFAVLQKKLGKYYKTYNKIPSSAELGFDIVKSIFEVGVQQQLDEIALLVTDAPPGRELANSLTSNLEVLVELAESFNLSGFADIAKVGINALEINPNRAREIGTTVLADLRKGQQQVISGDRSRGGEPSEKLQKMLVVEINSPSESKNNSLLESIWGEEEKLDLKSIETIDRRERQEEELEIEDPTKELEESESLEAEIVTEERWDEETQQSQTLQKIISGSSPEQEKMSAKNQPPSIPSEKSESVDYSTRSVRVKLQGLQNLDYSVGELLINQNYKISEEEKLQEAVKKLLKTNKQHRQTLSRLQDKVEKLLIANRQQQLEIQTSVTFALDNEQLNRHRELYQLSSLALQEIEAIEASAKSIELRGKNSQVSGREQQRLLDNVRDDLMKARMQPLKEVFTRFYRTVKQLEIAYHKPANLKLIGTDVLIDKAIAEKLYAPLLHLVQNAFAHGIEPVEIRRQQGKSDAGQIEIRAVQQVGKTIIEVRDDGRGIDFERVRARAIDMNLYTAEQALKLSSEELSELIFQPGFSTASKTSDIAGRGIGLEIVKAQVESLEGNCTLRSQSNRGTSFLLEIPLTVTISKLTIIETAGVTYALLSDTVEKILNSDSSPLQFIEGQKVLIWRVGEKESIVSVSQISELINYKSSLANNIHKSRSRLQDKNQKKKKTSWLSPPSSTHLILLRDGEELLGLEVDRIIGEQESVIRPLDKAIEPPSYVLGYSVLSNTNLTLVIDGISLTRGNRSASTIKFNPSYFNDLQDKETSQAKVGEALPAVSVSQSQILHSSPPPSASAVPTVLIVDDSQSQRKLLTTTLQKEGYRIIEAENGKEAIETMVANHFNIQLVICDIEMPQLSGYEFLYHYRQRPELIEIPVVMLTSHSGEESRVIALGLGAKAYFTKPFLESDFLSTVANLIQKSLKKNSFSKFLPFSDS
ncbi:MAG: hybrid sensor histidine kinase/response regulator [Prochloraceae cyanobacterium]|nr:hybrid sensor histidine kinase/response regulator [Prochloraceae cyanobacterium]